MVEIMSGSQTNNKSSNLSDIAEHLGKRSIVLVGMMGCGKSSVGRRLAAHIHLPFADADDEIERAAGKTIPEIFADYGEAHFRDRECRIIKRILEDGPQVIATGGGAFMRVETREAIARHGLSIWLKVELQVLIERVSRRNDRPLLNTADPKLTMQKLMDERYPVYKLADITVESRSGLQDDVVRDVIRGLNRYLTAETEIKEQS